jgi:hypothetical protein
VVVTPNVIKVSPNPATVGLNQTVTLTAAGAVPDNGKVGYEWTLVTNNSHSPESIGSLGNNPTKSYIAGATAGTDTIRVSDTWGNVGEVQVVVTPSAVSAPTSVPLQCKAPVPPAKTSAPVSLTQDVTVRDTVGYGQTCAYTATVSSGVTYVLSLTGIVGAAQLKVFDDAAHKHPTECLAPTNLANSTFMQDADCTFVATGRTIYATVTGTIYSRSPLAAYHYNIRLSPHFDGKPVTEGKPENPKPIPVNTPYGGTVGPAKSETSYYVANTPGSGEVVISLTGLTGAQGMDLVIYGNPTFQYSRDSTYCSPGEFDTHPESCELPAGKTYYIEIRNQSEDKIGGPFTLMVDAPGSSPTGTVAPAPAVPRAPAAAISTSATP